MALDITLEKDVLIPASENPDDHAFYWAVNLSYTSREGSGMVMSALRRMSTGADNWRQRKSTIQRWMSPDNGATWTGKEPELPSGSYDSKDLRLPWMHFLDPSTDRLLSVYQTSHSRPGGEGGATALFYEISNDQGRTWSPARQIIHPDPAFDEAHWMPGVTDNLQYVGVDQAPFARLDDGTIVFGFTVHPHAPDFPTEQFYVGVIFLRGRWSDDLSQMAWESGDVVQVPPEVSPYGACEPDLVHLGGQRMFITMRCQGEYEPAGVFSTKQWAISEDGGRTWSDPQMLCYEDGAMVCAPASLSAFETDPSTGKIYWFANILDKPVTDQLPRYPLAMAEFDPQRLCLIKDTVTVIQDLPDGAPANRGYTNFGHYVDRVTGQFVLTMAEMPKYSVKDFRADTVRYRIKVN